LTRAGVGEKALTHATFTREHTSQQPRRRLTAEG
jgi:hypothetical protein